MCFRSLSMHGSTAYCARLKLSMAMIAVSAALSLSFWSAPVLGQVGGGGVGGGGVGGGGIGGGGNNNNGNFNLNRVVGGVSIRPDGVLQTATAEEQNTALADLRSRLIGPQGELKHPTDRRLVSLKNLKKIVLSSIAENKPLPEEVLFLGGLTRIENIFVYPERQDIVLSGPAEPWKIGTNGTVVGGKSGRPVLYFDDLLCAFKTVLDARKTGISVSIEPTKEGVVRLEQLLKQSGKSVSANPRVLEPAMVEAFGPQQIKLDGLPADSHMARVILAADFRMKLYGMNLAKAPVAGLPSYLEMVSQQANLTQLQSRWWMACDYSAIEHSQDRMAWKISGPGIKTLTEAEQVSADGSFKQSGKMDRLAKKWADLFTKKLDELATKDTVFGDLRNVMDMCIVAALIESQELQSLSHCDLSGLMGESGKVELAKFEVPTAIDPQCSFIKTVQGWVVTASGGVMVDSWETVSHLKANDAVAGALELGATWKKDDRIWQ